MNDESTRQLTEKITALELRVTELVNMQRMANRAFNSDHATIEGIRYVLSFSIAHLKNTSREAILKAIDRHSALHRARHAPDDGSAAKINGSADNAPVSTFGEGPSMNARIEGLESKVAVLLEMLFNQAAQIAGVQAIYGPAIARLERRGESAVAGEVDRAAAEEHARLMAEMKLKTPKLPDSNGPFRPDLN